jgi:hypothetical protein
MTFYNQLDHDHLDRTLIRGLLLGLRETSYATTSDEGRWSDLEAAAVKSLELEVLTKMRKLGFPAPDELHEIIRFNGDPIAEADIFYHPKLVVLIDGPDHEKDYVAVADEAKRKKLKARGYQIIVIHHSNVDGGIKELAERLNVSL